MPPTLTFFTSPSSHASSPLITFARSAPATSYTVGLDKSVSSGSTYGVATGNHLLHGVN